MALAITTVAAGAASVNIGGSADGGLDGTDVDNWTTNNTSFVDPSPGPTNLGLAFDWENVTTNTVTLDTLNNKFDYDYQSNANHTIGHGFLFNETFDLSQTTAGIESLSIVFDFNSTTHNNWSPMMLVGGKLYRWNHSNNSFNGTAEITVGDPALNAASTTWGELVDTATGFGGTRLNGTNPDLTATSGDIQFGFIQWGASSGGAADSQGSNTVDKFEWTVGYTAVPEPSSAALLGLGGLALILRRRKS